jgi:hypothetical protein
MQKVINFMQSLALAVVCVVVFSFLTLKSSGFCMTEAKWFSNDELRFKALLAYDLDDSNTECFQFGAPVPINCSFANPLKVKYIRLPSAKMTFLLPDCCTVIDKFPGGQDYVIPDASAFTRLIGGVHKIVRMSFFGSWNPPVAGSKPLTPDYAYRSVDSCGSIIPYVSPF